MLLTNGKQQKEAPSRRPGFADKLPYEEDRSQRGGGGFRETVSGVVGGLSSRSRVAEPLNRRRGRLFVEVEHSVLSIGLGHERQKERLAGLDGPAFPTIAAFHFSGRVKGFHRSRGIMPDQSNG